MNAPVLVPLAVGEPCPRAARALSEIAELTRRMRPDLRIEPAFLAAGEAGLEGVAGRAETRGDGELVVVPLLLSSEARSDIDLAGAAMDADSAHPEVTVRLAEPIGPDLALLEVLDERLRAALRVARVRELDALVLAAMGSRSARSDVSLARLARRWGARHHLPTAVAFANASPPTTGEAVRDWRRQGRRQIAVGSLFATPGASCDYAAELALEAGAVAVSGPLGAHSELSRLLLSRFAVTALELLPLPA